MAFFSTPTKALTPVFSTLINPAYKAQKCQKVAVHFLFQGRRKAQRRFTRKGLVETAAVPYLGLRVQDLSIDEKAEILFLDQGITTAAVPAVLYTVASTFQPLPQDVYRYDLKDPFSLQKGWLLWAGIRLAGAIATIAVTGAAASLFRGESTESEKDALVSLLPQIGSSSVSTACLLGITGVLAPILEETVFRVFLWSP